MSDETFSKLLAIVKEVKPSVKDVSGETNLPDALGFDSLDLMNLFFEVEKIFDIKISDEDISENRLSSIDKIMSYIENR